MEENINLLGFLGDGKIQKVDEKGIIIGKTKNALQKIIVDVFYVPGIAQNFQALASYLIKATR